MNESRRLATVIFADIVGYSAMMQADEKKALQLLDGFKNILEEEIIAHEGRIVQYFGDGCLATFESAFQGVNASKALQEGFIANAIPVRIGMHLGDVIYKNENIFGDGVNIASRVESLGIEGSVLMTKSIRDQVKNQTEFSLKCLDEFHFKNIAEPISIYALSNPGFKVPKPEEMHGKLKSLEKDNSQKEFLPRSPKRNKSLALAIVGLVGLLLIGFLFKDRLPISSQKNTSPGIQSQKAIAVLPFSNLSESEGNYDFSAAMHEDVLNKLAGIKELRVISRTSVQKFRGFEGDLDEIGKQLNVQYVVEGSVSRWDNQIKITANLIDINTEKSLWSDSYNRELQNIFELQNEIAQEIVENLKTNISKQSLESITEIPTTVMEAYDNYVNARNIFNTSWYQYDKLMEAIGFLNKAVDYDPNFIKAWSLLAHAQSERFGRLNEVEEKEESQEARSEAEKALNKLKELQADGFYFHRANGYYEDLVTGSQINAVTSFNKALEIVPNDARTLGYLAQTLFKLGQLKEAVSCVEKAYAINNQDGMVQYMMTYGYELTLQYAKAVPIFEKLLEIEPEKTHYNVQAKYFQFLADGKLESFRAYEEAVKNVEETNKYDSRSVLNNEMVVAMFNKDFSTYIDAWRGKWDAHHRSHGNWSCPMIINDEANQANLSLKFGDAKFAYDIIDRAKSSITRPYHKHAFCIFNKVTYNPKLAIMSGDTLAARKEFEAAVPEIMNNNLFPRGPVERSVLLETADLVAPDQVYSIYKQITAKPVSFTSLATICSNPWIYPNLIKDPDFIKEIREDGRFVEFLEHQGLIPSSSS